MACVKRGGRGGVLFTGLGIGAFFLGLASDSPWNRVDVAVFSGSFLGLV